MLIALCFSQVYMYMINDYMLVLITAIREQKIENRKMEHEIISQNSL